MGHRRYAKPAIVDCNFYILNQSGSGSRRVSHGKPIAGIVPKDRKGWQPRLVIRG
jgi:hypothetical protein